MHVLLKPYRVMWVFVLMMDKRRPGIGIFVNEITVGVRVNRLAPLLLKGMRMRWLHWANIGSELNR